MQILFRIIIRIYFFVKPVLFAISPTVAQRRIDTEIRSSHRLPRMRTSSPIFPKIYRAASAANPMYSFKAIDVPRSAEAEGITSNNVP